MNFITYPTINEIDFNLDYAKGMIRRTNELLAQTATKRDLDWLNKRTTNDKGNTIALTHDVRR